MTERFERATGEIRRSDVWMARVSHLADLQRGAIGQFECKMTVAHHTASRNFACCGVNEVQHFATERAGAFCLPQHVTRELAIEPHEIGR